MTNTTDCSLYCIMNCALFEHDSLDSTRLGTGAEVHMCGIMHDDTVHISYIMMFCVCAFGTMWVFGIWTEDFPAGGVHRDDRLLPSRG